MAFDPKSLIQMCSMPRGAGKTTTIWGYSSADAVATIEAAGYFNSDRGKLKANDIIVAMALADATGVQLLLKVTASPATGNVTVAELAGSSPAPMTAGAGVAGMETYKSGVSREGDIIVTKLLIDLTGLVASATDLDIIGDSAAASANLGQITAALNGTIFGGRITCLEVPAGGPDDVDFYSATVGTGAQDVDVTTLTETALVTSGGAWTLGASKGLSGLPPANDFLYAVNGEAAAGGTFTAGKFLIELFGV